jgi:6-phosphogluconolactonase/glucosamine-6-phosphate isomerase/deaminase
MLMDRIGILQEIPYREKEGIFIVNSPTAISASKTIRKLLANYSDAKTALFLSGGNTPKKLYEEIAEEKALRVGAVLQVDERFGERFHKKSNELMIKDTGLLKFLEDQNIRFYPILEDKDIEPTASDYDETLRFLFKYFPKTVGIFGIGEDGHIAGIPSIPEISKRIFDDQSSLITFYEDESGKYGARITMSYLAISQLDLIIVLVLGQEKRETLAQIFKGESVEEMPARILLKPGYAAKTIIVTDQML